MKSDNISIHHVLVAMNHLESYEKGKEAMDHIRDTLKSTGELTRHGPEVQRRQQHREGVR
jgi:hypothetical protein